MQHELERLFDALWQRSIDIEREMCVFSKTLFSHVFPTSFKSQLPCRLVNTSTHPNWSKSHSRGCEEIHYSIFHETLTLNSSHNWTTECLSFTSDLFPFFLFFFSAHNPSSSLDRRKIKWNCWKRNRLTGKREWALNDVFVASYSEWADLILTLLLSCYNLQFSLFLLYFTLIWCFIESQSKGEEMCSNKNVYKQAGEREADEWMNQEAQLLLCRTGARSSKKMSFLLFI